MEKLYIHLKAANLSPIGDRKPSTKREFRASFVRRCKNHTVNEKLHLIRTLNSTLKVHIPCQSRTMTLYYAITLQLVCEFHKYVHLRNWVTRHDLISPIFFFPLVFSGTVEGGRPACTRQGAGGPGAHLDKVPGVEGGQCDFDAGDLWEAGPAGGSRGHESCSVSRCCSSGRDQFIRTPQDWF